MREGSKKAKNLVAARFGRNLRERRLRAELSQEELGRCACLHRTEIGLLERGTRIPRVDTLIQLASVLAVSPDELLAGILWKPDKDQGSGRFWIETPT